MTDSDKEIKRHSNKEDTPVYNMTWEAPDEDTQEMLWSAGEAVPIPMNYWNE